MLKNISDATKNLLYLSNWGIPNFLTALALIHFNSSFLLSERIMRVSSDFEIMSTSSIEQSKRSSRTSSWQYCLFSFLFLFVCCFSYSQLFGSGIQANLFLLDDYVPCTFFVINDLFLAIHHGLIDYISVLYPKAHLVFHWCLYNNRL